MVEMMLISSSQREAEMRRDGGPRQGRIGRDKALRYLLLNQSIRLVTQTKSSLVWSVYLLLRYSFPLA